MSDLYRGYGSGSGRGDGSGSGNGDGNGDGSGRGNGDESGFGYGSGSGDGSGDGSGSGYGYGSGDGSGDGSGSIHIEREDAPLCWHFVPEDRKLRYEHEGDRLEIEEGLVLHCDPEELALCRYGLHSSRSKEDARSYCDGIACRVRVWGRVLMGSDKVCAEYREVVEMV